MDGKKEVQLPENPVPVKDISVCKPNFKLIAGTEGEEDARFNLSLTLRKSEEGKPGLKPGCVMKLRAVSPYSSSLNA